MAEVAGGWSLLCVGGSLGCGRCVATGSGRLAVDFAPMLPNVGRRWDGCSRLQLLLGATALPQPGEVAHRTNCLVDAGWVGVGGLVDTNLFGPGQWVGGRLFDLMAWDSRWGGFGRPASEAMGIGTVGHGSTWLWERMQAQPRSRRGRSMTKVLGPCWLHVGRGGRFWKRSCCGLIVALHLKQTHIGCHVLVDGWWTGAQAKCRKSGSSCHASSSSALAGSINKRRGQHRMTVCSGGGGAAVISAVGVLTLLGSVWGGCGRSGIARSVGPRSRVPMGCGKRGMKAGRSV